MKYPRHYLLVAVTVAVATTASLARADDTGDAAVEKPWLLSISAGVMNWEKLSNIESSLGGKFDDAGFGLEFAAHKRVSMWGNADVLVGVDLGVFGMESDIRGTFINLTQRGLYVTPSVKLGFGERFRYFLEAGAGWYNVDFAEVDCSAPYAYCAELDAPYNADALGAYLGIRAQLGRTMYLGLRAHHADFGPVTGINSVSADLKGPFYLLSVGAGF